MIMILILEIQPPEKINEAMPLFREDMISASTLKLSPVCQDYKLTLKLP